MNDEGPRTATEVRKPSPLEVIFERISGHNERILNLGTTATASMDRILGPEPPAAAGEKAPESPAECAISKILNRINTQDSLLNHLENAIHRISKLG